LCDPLRIEPAKTRILAVDIGDSGDAD
jgi:hypothetical protein